jgi:hypothetical protein
VSSLVILYTVVEQPSHSTTTLVLTNSMAAVALLQDIDIPIIKKGLVGRTVSAINHRKYLMCDTPLTFPNIRGLTDTACFIEHDTHIIDTNLLLV